MRVDGVTIRGAAFHLIYGIGGHVGETARTQDRSAVAPDLPVNDESARCS
jgi:hypothetical protein